MIPQPFLSLLILGIALLAAGLALHLLRARLAPSLRVAASSASTPVQLSNEAHLVGRVVERNPYSEAAAMERQHGAVKARKALRRIREKLRDDRRHVQRASEGEIGQIRQISSQVWREEEETLLELTDPKPHSGARQAYRELGGIEEVLYIRESPSTLRIRKQARELLDTDVQTTTEAIVQAIQSLSEAENDI